MMTVSRSMKNSRKECEAITVTRRKGKEGGRREEVL
jgi:hypothetical protein